MKAEPRAHHARFGRRSDAVRRRRRFGRDSPAGLPLAERLRKSDDDGSIGGGEPEPTPSQGSRVKGQWSRRFRKPSLLDWARGWAVREVPRRFRRRRRWTCARLRRRCSGASPRPQKVDRRRPTAAKNLEEEDLAQCRRRRVFSRFRLRTLLDSIERRGERSLESSPRVPSTRASSRSQAPYVPCPRMRGADVKAQADSRARGPKAS